MQIIIDSMGTHHLIILIRIIISFLASIFSSFVITNYKKLQTNSMCNIDCNKDGKRLSSSSDSILLTSQLGGNTVDPQYDIYFIMLGKTTFH